MFASLRKASSASDWNSRPSTVQPSIFEMHRETGFSSSRFRFYYPPPLRQQLQVSLRSVFFELSISKSRRRKTCFPPETWKVTDGGPMHVASSPCGQWRHGRPRTRRAGGGADWAARGRPKSGWPAAVAVSVIAAVACRLCLRRSLHMYLALLETQDRFTRLVLLPVLPTVQSE